MARTFVRVMADIRAAEAELKRLAPATEGTPEAEERRQVAARLEALRAEWRELNRRFEKPVVTDKRG